MSRPETPVNPLKKRSPFVMSEDYFEASFFTLLHVEVERPAEASQGTERIIPL